MESVLIFTRLKNFYRTAIFGIIKEAKYDSSTRWIVSVLQNNGVKYMVIINLDYEKGHQINLKFVESRYSVWKFYGNNSYSPAITGINEYVEAGGMVVYRFKENP